MHVETSRIVQWITLILSLGHSAINSSVCWLSHHTRKGHSQTQLPTELWFMKQTSYFNRPPCYGIFWTRFPGAEQLVSPKTCLNIWQLSFRWLESKQFGCIRPLSFLVHYKSRMLLLLHSHVRHNQTQSAPTTPPWKMLRDQKAHVNYQPSAHKSSLYQMTLTGVHSESLYMTMKTQML